MEYRQLFTTLKIMGWVNNGNGVTMIYSPIIDNKQFRVHADKNYTFYLAVKDIHDKKHIWIDLYPRDVHTGEEIIEKVNALSET